jgi:hypothetical protein
MQAAGKKSLNVGPLMTLRSHESLAVHFHVAGMWPQPFILGQMDTVHLMLE